MGFRYLTLARAGLVVAALATALASPAAAQTSLNFALEGSFIGPYAPFLVAEDRGFYKAAGLNISIEAKPAPADPISRVAAGFADMALADINAVVRFRDLNPGARLKTVFIFYNKPAYAVVARKSRGIAQPKDLEGKRIGAPPGEMASALWPAFAKLNDIDVSKVRIENLAAAIREPMLAAGQIDAVTGTSFFAYLNLKERGVPLDDLVTLQMADYGLPLYGDAIIVNADFAAEHPDAVKGFLRALLKGLRETIPGPARAVDSVLRRNDSANKNIELERLRMAIQDNIFTEEVQANGFGDVDADRLMRGIELMTQTFKLKTKIEPADVFDASFLPSPAERKIGAARPG
jgi:NitT/TauT family transport system substrate-binding protein